MKPPSALQAAIAAHRFGLGEPDLAAIGNDPRGWLLAQIGPADAHRGRQLPGLAAALARQTAARRQDSEEARAALRQQGQADIRARLVTAATTQRPFAERLALFWANHFTVSVGKGSTQGLAGAFEREAIRPHIAGRFADLLHAAVSHPAMLRYLDNPLSAGPQSAVVQRLRRRSQAGAETGAAAAPRLTGLNENLAREVLELHTLGVAGGGGVHGPWGGYEQADVAALAAVLTGWRGPRTEPPALSADSSSHFDPLWHQPGAKTVLGRSHAEGPQALRAVLDDLARHPSTARHIATKLARHLVADQPAPALVARLARRFTETDGDLPALYGALVDAPEAWEAGPAKPGGPRLVLVLLRGGLDGLSLVPAPGDPAFADARGALGRFASPALPLDPLMALHPALGGLHRLYTLQELLVVHATGLPYRDRSHFDAQQVLESGGAKPFALDTGWLGRALAEGEQKGLALQTAVPLVLRGHADIDTWAPSTRPEPAPDLIARLARLYASDPALSQALARARDLRLDGAMAGAAGPAMSAPMAGAMTPVAMAVAPGMAGAEGTATPMAPGRPLVLALARQAAKFLAQPDGPQAAVLSLGGWDTHANQAGETGPLVNNLGTLEAALLALRDGLSAAGSADTWRRTVVLVVTEFGRTVAINGTQGTDHGSGGAALVLGGAVRGGRVLTDWPGLAPAQRHEGRDLRVTTDLRAIFRSVLIDHLGLPAARVGQQILPGTAALAALPLLRG